MQRHAGNRSQDATDRERQFSQQLALIRRIERLLRADAIEALDRHGEKLELLDELAHAIEQLDQAATGVWKPERSADRYSVFLEQTPEPFLLTDSQGLILDGNEAAARMLGVQMEFLTGFSLLLYVTPQQLPLYRALLQAALRGEPVADSEIWLRPARLEPILVNVSLTSEAGGSSRTVFWQFRDITQQRRAELAMLRTNAELEERVEARTREHAAEALRAEAHAATVHSIIRQLTDCLLVFEANGPLILANGAAEERFPPARDPTLTLARFGEWLASQISDVAVFHLEWAAAISRPEHRRSFEVHFAASPNSADVVQVFDIQRADQVATGIFIRDVSATKRLALFEERERISMDLHDGVTQSLYAITLGLGAGRRQTSVERLHRTMDSAIDQLGGVVGEVRNAINALAPVSQPADQALRKMIAELWDTSEVTFDLDGIQPDTGGEAADKTFALLIIAREAISNAIRHGNPSRIRVELSTNGRIQLTVVDDGTGFDTSSVMVDNRGLRNMRERARALGGECTIDSIVNQGTTVRVWLPIVTP